MTKVFILFTIFLLSSCVGTVQDAKVKLNNLFDEDKHVLNFSGLEEARAISHNKVELEFTPVADSDPNLKYQLYINNSLTPIEINPDSLDRAASGRVRYLVDGLAINSKYKFRLRLINTLTGTMSKGEKELTADTFDNKTADFKGVTSLTKINGQSDSSIRVDWVSAIMEGSTTTGPWDPLYYEITIIGPGGVANLNNPAYTGPDKRKIRVPPAPTNLSPFNYTKWTSEVIGSLAPNTEYYVQVRAVHRVYDEFLQNPEVTIIPIDREVNTKFLTIKTDPSTGVFDFNSASFKAQPGFGSQAKSRILTSWVPASGSYVGYRLFYVKCTGTQCGSEEEVLGTDLLTDDNIEDIIAGTLPNSGWVGVNELPSPTTSYVLTGLDAYSWYQLRLVACRNALCSKDAGDAIHSELRAVRTAPILAPFSGITTIRHPDTATSMDQINLQFDLPDLSTGYADQMEFFCINPDSVTAAQDNLEYIKLTPGSVSSGATGFTQCNGLSLCGPNASDCESDSFNYTVASGTNVRLKGIKTDGTRYCFAAFPAIRGEAEELPLTNPTKDWIIRCVTPEVKTPTIAEFPGVSGSCSVVNNTISVAWAKPQAGIYSAYRVLWRKIQGNENFSFSGATQDVVNGKVNTLDSPYFSSPTLDPETLNYTITDLRPGTRYKVGVLTQTLGGTDIKWSEFNTNIRDCVTAMPKFKFEEWTRIFAIGPKVDGRFPYRRDYVEGNPVRSIMSDAYIYEALNHDGIPYELSINSIDGTVDVEGLYFKSPGSYGGSYSPAGFGDDFDGAPGNLGDGDTLIAASKNGIISLAWKDVTLDFLGNEFKDCQVNAGESTPNTYCYRDASGALILPAMKKYRRYGYKVFRSADNRLTWQDITKSSMDADNESGSSLIYAKDYSYYKRADLEPTVERMAFFTDYSVKAMKNEPLKASRARIYWYRIVPYFDNKPLTIDPSQSGMNAPNEIKVILPPDNMALVHRWMANRQACNEIERGSSMDKAANYTCAFNGFGAKAKGFPWNPTNTVVDLGGHLLIDRFELGCNFTRGDKDALPTADGNSHFERLGPYSGYRSQLSEFRGFATNSDGTDNTSKLFMGCAQAKTQDVSATLPYVNWGSGSSSLSNYRSFIQGDCVGYGAASMASTSCAGNPDEADIYVWATPGVFHELNPNGTSTAELDCANSTPDKPTVANELLSLTFRKNVIVQSEFAGVLHHTHRGTSTRYLNPEGPTGTTLNWSGTENSWGKPLSCYINLAAIGADNNWVARWFPAADLDIIKGNTKSAHVTLNDLKTNGNLYDSTNYKYPGKSLHNDIRFDEDTKLGRIISSNAAKLPPITNLSPEVAQSMCSTYEVEVGFSNNGNNFLTLTLPKQKRLLGRQELVAASAWPEAGPNDLPENYDYKETASNPRITNLEGATGPGFCVDNLKATGQQTPDHGSAMSPAFPRQRYTTPPTGLGNGSTVLFSGSSHNDDPDIHSQLCMSRYGIQDIIGNAAEITTDRIFCDYGADKLYFGRYEAGQGYELESARMPDYDGDDDDIVWLGAKVIRETGTGDVELISGTGTQGRMWADISPNSGYCSLVDDVDPGLGYNGLVSRFRDNNDNFAKIRNPDGSINTAVVQRQNPVVQDNIDKLRNGDGYFLNFGTNMPGPYLQRSNSWALSKSGYSWESGMALGPYFNPIIGMTMRCIGSTCNQSEDNMIASTSYFIDDDLAPKPTVTPSIPKFPVGNSQLLNHGISETVYTNGTTSFSIDFSDDMQRRGSYQVIYEIRIKLNGSVEYSRMPMRAWAMMEFGSYNNAGIQNFSKLRFVLPRGAPLHFTHGGDATTSKTGRFSLQTLVGTRVGSQRTGDYTAARCGVMIED